MEIKRHQTKVIKIGTTSIGGNYPIAIQSMVKTKTSDVQRTVQQIKELTEAGCEIIRVAVKDYQDARAIRNIKKQTKIPLVADIHFSSKLAREAIDNGADKIRLNPGNIYKREEIKEIVMALKQAKIPLRVGVNSGSVKDSDSKRASMTDRLVASAQAYIRIIEKLGFYDMVISLKASNVLDTITAYRKMSEICEYPLHLGVTATGVPFAGAVKSSIAVGSLLLEGIGDTMRVSLTARPKEEVRVAKYILESLGLRHFGPEIISCPTCGRCEVDLVKIVANLEKQLSAKGCKLSTQPLKVALMGCVVNGPGEAKEADLGVAFGKKEGLFFKNGRAIKKVSASRCISFLRKEMEEFSA